MSRTYRVKLIHDIADAKELDPKVVYSIWCNATQLGYITMHPINRVWYFKPVDTLFYWTFDGIDLVKLGELLLICTVGNGSLLNTFYVPTP